MFLDRVKIWVHAGAGGDGAATFRQEAHVPRGGPDGGDGGRGGSVELRVDPGQTTLRDFQYRHHFKATPGGRGTRSRRHGKAGEDLVLDVPPGTAVYDDATGALVADLVAAGQVAMIARGGRGGLGNTHFKTSTHQAPKHAQKGEPGEERWLRLELRLIADVGLVGLPNAGKSTILAATTAAVPKIADYPFTTLEPNLGVLDLGDEDERRPTIADVPGLIEGASAGAGLGHAFLRHVERTRVLVHVVDGASRDPAWDYDIIREELRAHDPALLDKPMLVAFNKMDLPAAREAWPAFQAARVAEGIDVVALAASTGEGLDAFRVRVAEMLPSLDELAEPPEPAGVVVHRIDAMGDGFVVEHDEDGAFRVRGKRIERIAAQTNFDVEESAERFQRDLARLGHRVGTAAGRHRRRRPRPDRRVRARMGSESMGGPVTARPPRERLDALQRRGAPRGRGGLGVFGGTFDPIHLAHLAVAEAARDAVGLEQVLFIPAGVPPHKQGEGVSPAEHRLAMVELAIAGNPAFAASRLELDRDGPSYTVDTLETLCAEQAEVGKSGEVALIVSAEAFLDLPTWRSPERILELATLVVAPRDGYPEADASFLERHFPGTAARAVFLDGPRLRLSASDLRARAAAGRTLRYLVPDAVVAYIGDHGLYQHQGRIDRS